MGEWIGRGRKARRSYGFDEIAIVPGMKTIDPADADISWNLGEKSYPLPFMAAAMDGVVDPKFAVEFWKFGGLAILNMEGVWSRYEDPTGILEEIASATPDQATELVQRLYVPELKPEFAGRRIEWIKQQGAPATVSATPMQAATLGPVAREAGADVFVLQSTVSSAHHESRTGAILNLAKFVKEMAPIPVIIGNAVTYEATLALMETGAAGILIGVGPGAACTTRGVLGVGVPQVTATVDAAAARNHYYLRTGRYVPVITDGGMSVGGDVCKAFASGADAVLIGSAFAKAEEAPGRGFHWGMATPHHNLPRGTRVHVGTKGSLEEILVGPASLDDGSQNLAGALKTCMGYVGANTIREMHEAELVIAPAIKREGKIYQKAQLIGMGK